MDESHTERGDPGKGCGDVLEHQRPETICDQEDADHAHSSREDDRDLRIVIGADRRLDVAIDEPGEQTRNGQRETHESDDRA